MCKEKQEKCRTLSMPFPTEKHDFTEKTLADFDQRGEGPFSLCCVQRDAPANTKSAGISSPTGFYAFLARTFFTASTMNLSVRPKRSAR